MAKGLSTGSLDMVLLRMAKAPMIQRTQKYRSLTIFPRCKAINPYFLEMLYFDFRTKLSFLILIPSPNRC
jgi:hypothetical protein